MSDNEERNSESKYYLVHFYADGGNGGPYQACRTFTNPQLAENFADARRLEWVHEPHGKAFADYVRVEPSDSPGETTDDGLTFDEMVAKEREWREHDRQLRDMQRNWLERLLIRLGLGWLL